MFSDIDWFNVFGLTMNPLELVVRGSAMFWFLYALFRFVLRRDIGSIAMADILILVIIADASQNAMAGEYKSVSDGMVLVGTIIGWNVLVDWLAFRYVWLRRILEAPMVVLVRNGRINRSALKEQLMCVEDLRAKLRDAGVESVNDVKLATFESNGDFSVIKRKHKAS
ncbi:MAG: YetF domain-containing protein [Betaproteobacteria bacterium]